MVECAARKLKLRAPAYTKVPAGRQSRKQNAEGRQSSRNGLTGYHVRDRFLVYNRPKEIPAIFCSGGETHGFEEKTRDGVDSGLS